MKINYRYAFKWSPERGAVLRELGLRVDAPVSGEGVANAYAEEGHSGWSVACQLIRSWDGSEFITTEFTGPEISGAEYCVLGGIHTNGYPQPEEGYGYRQITYSSENRCSKCGAGLSQAAAFRVKKSLKWGRNSFLQLYWVVDEYFMPAAVWESKLAPLGVAARPVEDTKGFPVEGVVQLVADRRVAFDMGSARGEICSLCGRERYRVNNRGYYPAPAGSPDIPIFRSEQIFGSGRMSFNEIIVRSDVVSVIVAERLRGVTLSPCAPK
jgi:hypothetical protein